MPRPLHGPPFPESPGTWLACYRFRWQPEGRPYSPEQIGTRLGVSGTTIRRWELDLLSPTWDDLLRFADVCNLTPLETQFLFRAFHGREAEAAPRDGDFQELVSQSFDLRQPAFLMDSLFYIRARNSYMASLAAAGSDERAEAPPGPRLNGVAGIFGTGRIDRMPADVEDSTRRWLRSFWYTTAGAAGTEPYRELLRRLRKLEDFEAQWWSLALTSESASAPIDLPFIYEHPVRGRYRVYITRVVLPPVYYLREYTPMDRTAEDYVDSLRHDGPNLVEINGPSHWSIAD